MAQRQIYDRQVLNVVGDTTGPADFSSALTTIAKVGGEIVQQHNDARLLEASSAARLDLSKIAIEHKLKYENDPFNERGEQEFKSATNSIFQKYGGNLSPLSKRAWQSATQDLQTQISVDNQSWQYKQAAVNTKNDIIKSTRNYLNQASIDGELFGGSDETAISSFANYMGAQKQLTEFGSKYLGEETSTKLLDSFSQDWTKSFISGVAKQNPVKALQMLDNEQVKSSITDQEDFMKFRQAIETKAMNFQGEAIQREVLGKMKSQIELFNDNRTLSYSELRQATEGMSEPAQDYFLQRSGFKEAATEQRSGFNEAATGKARKLSDVEKTQTAYELFSEVGKLTNQKEGVTADQVDALQSKIFESMNTGAISREQGQFFTESLIGPYAQKLAANLQQYSGNDLVPFNNDVGFEQVQQYFNESVVIDEGTLTGKEKEFAKFTNAKNAYSLYNQYYDSLNKELSAIRNPSFPSGMTINDIGNLSRKERNNLFARAQKDALDVVGTNNIEKRKTVSSIPLAHIQKLKENPELAPKFDEAYGTGSANRVLGK
jgi:hypothetical protein